MVNWIVNPAGLTDRDELARAVRGKIILITGASFGLGQATARKLGAAGATVLLVARSADRLDELVAEITAAGGNAHAYPADLTDMPSVAALAKRLLDEHDHIDVVVNNAGKSIRRSLHRQYDRFHDFQRTADINYLGPVQLLLGLLPSMRERGQGHIVNVSTIGVRIAPGPRWGAYQASKGAFDTWLRSVTPEVLRDGVTVSTIYMALIYTRMSAPTPIMRKLPGLRADEAADLVAKAIVRRPSSIAPWWLWPAEVASVAARGPVSRGMSLLTRVGKDGT
jgi:NAD(P)-dependent dehydrogenase (short-subunit alcohol dehydrogenase family)